MHGPLTDNATYKCMQLPAHNFYSDILKETNKNYFEITEIDN